MIKIMRKFMFLLMVMFAFTISTTAQVRDSINGTAIEGIYLGNETVADLLNGATTDYVTDIWYLGQFYNTGRGIAVYATYTYLRADSTLIRKDKNKRLSIPLQDSILGKSVKQWYDLDINERSAKRYAWMFWFTYSKNQ